LDTKLWTSERSICAADIGTLLVVGGAARRPGVYAWGRATARAPQPGGPMARGPGQPQGRRRVDDSFVRGAAACEGCDSLVQRSRKTASMLLPSGSRTKAA
jgi:hypothetical protein